MCGIPYLGCEFRLIFLPSIFSSPVCMAFYREEFHLLLNKHSFSDVVDSGIDTLTNGQEDLQYKTKNQIYKEYFVDIH